MASPIISLLLHLYMYMYMYIMQVYIYMCMYMYMCVYMYVLNIYTPHTLQQWPNIDMISVTKCDQVLRVRLEGMEVMREMCVVVVEWHASGRILYIHPLALQWNPLNSHVQYVYRV